MTDLLNLGHLYVSDFLAPGEEPRAAPAELRLVMDDETGVVHLAEQPAPELMWGRYWYRSGTNATMRAELHDIVTEIGGLVALEDGDVWVDIACNDGTLLAEVPSGVLRIGVDPVEGEILELARHHANFVLNMPFTSEAAEELTYMGAPMPRPAKVITCIAMFYDLLDPTDFLAGVHRLLDDDGVFVLQMSYTPLMLEQLAFDNICHEHARYYTLRTLDRVLSAAGLRIVDVSLNETNGGSFRVVAQHTQAAPLGTAPWRDVATYRVNSLSGYEHVRGYNRPYMWRAFADRLERLRTEVTACVRGARSRGERVWAYGASTKGNTLLQYFGLDHRLIDGIAERQEAKVGLRTVGTDIPIVSEDEWRKACPEYTLMLPWHFVAEFTEREAGYLANGGRFIVPCPRFQVIGDGPVEAIGDGRRPA